jgi:hypothetical protein
MSKQQYKKSEANSYRIMCTTFKVRWLKPNRDKNWMDKMDFFFSIYNGVAIDAEESNKAFLIRTATKHDAVIFCELSYVKR